MTGGAIFAGLSGGGICRSTNSGKSWAVINSGLLDSNVNALASSGITILAGTNGGGIFRSTNNGAKWTAVNSGLTNTTVRALAVSGNTIFAGTDGSGIFRSTNNGTQWTAINSGLTDSTVFSFAVSGSAIFAGTFEGVFLSKNNGTNWTPVNSGLTSSYVLSLSINDATLFAGTYGDGVWRRPLSEMLPVNVQKPQQNMSPLANFKILSPSRTNHFATIEFYSPYSQLATARIYNLSGHEIASLVNENHDSGKCRFLWNTRDIAPGCYAVKMRVGANTYEKNIPVTR
jgi:ligand-binding sensor domain-containing protein